MEAYVTDGVPVAVATSKSMLRMGPLFWRLPKIYAVKRMGSIVTATYRFMQRT